MTQVFIDFETRSAAELKTCGVYVYADHPTTDVWCMAWAVDDGPVNLWRSDSPFPDKLFETIAQPDTQVIAHNAQFEYVIWNKVMTRKYGWPPLPIEKMRCTMAMAYAQALPGSLDGAVAALGLDMQKDQAGHRLMLQMARPRKIEDGKITWWDDEERRQRLYAYCRQDVETERALLKRLRPLSPKEQQVWQLDQTINERGIGVDKPLCHAAQKIVERAGKRLDERMRKVTQQHVGGVSNVQQLASWVRLRSNEDYQTAKAECDLHEEPEGWWLDIAGDKVSLAKDALADLLEEVDLPPDIEEALLIRQEGAKTSVAKIQTLLDGTSADGRARGLLQYHGASTGRWAGRRFQPQNLPRPALARPEIEAAIPFIAAGQDDLIELLYGPALSVVSDCVRSTIIPSPGHDLIAADFSAIEARVLAWLAGQNDLLRLFAADGPVYETMASRIYGRPIDKKKDPNERQMGKQVVLGCGFQMGAPKFRLTVKKYGMVIDLPFAEKVVTLYRESNDRIVDFWYASERAAVAAVREPGMTHRAGRVAFRKSGSFLWGQLPSGRLLCWPYARLADRMTPWGEMKEGIRYKGVNSYTRQWGEQDTYGGKIVENLTQAVARDLMAEAMLRVEAAGYEVCLSIHDEILCQVRTGRGDLKEFEALVTTVPDWAKGCPVAAEGWHGLRYRK